jgi:hypothetical protein
MALPKQPLIGRQLGLRSLCRCAQVETADRAFPADSARKSGRRILRRRAQISPLETEENYPKSRRAGGGLPSMPARRPAGSVKPDILVMAE